MLLAVAVCRAMQRPVFGLASAVVRQSATIAVMWEAKQSLMLRPKGEASFCCRICSGGSSSPAAAGAEGALTANGWSFSGNGSLPLL